MSKTRRLHQTKIQADFIKVLDFGLVKAAPKRGEDQTKLTAADITAGTPAYIAPELALGDEPDLRADLYSLGCVAYWLLSGQLVFEADTPMKMMMAHVNDAPTPPSARGSQHVPRDLEALILACLEKEPANRPATADELATSLQRCKIGAPWNAVDIERWWSANLPEFAPPTVSV